LLVIARFVIMNKMDVQKRRLETAELIEQRGEAKVAELSALFGVSDMTIRRDLEALQREGIIKRVRRGAISATSRSYEPPFALRAERFREEKSRIGRAASSMVSDGETVILDVGSTVLAAAEVLRERRNLTILTPSLRAAWLLADKPDLRVIVTGGIVRPGERSLVGTLSERAFESLYCDILFMGIGGINVRAGLTEFNLEDARVKQEAMKYSQRRIVLADASKLGKVAFMRVAGLEEVDALITDAGADPDTVAELRSAGLEVITA
jgi:DeoR/GlpR family transcriptional regulator of sugar metabolism